MNMFVHHRLECKVMSSEQHNLDSFVILWQVDKVIETVNVDERSGVFFVPRGRSGVRRERARRGRGSSLGRHIVLWRHSKKGFSEGKSRNSLSFYIVKEG